jgi:hypothetical protein
MSVPTNNRDAGISSIPICDDGFAHHLPSIATMHTALDR